MTMMQIKLNENNASKVRMWKAKFQLTNNECINKALEQLGDLV